MVLAVVAYLPALKCDFTNFDDGIYVTENPRVLDGLTPANIVWAFTTLDLANWHPLTWLSFELDATLFGLGPMGFHLTNLALHAANAALFWTVLVGLTRFPGRSFAAAALFATHPLHVESVAWVSERKDVLSTFFWLLAMLAYLRYVAHPGRARMAVVAVFLTLGLLAKQMLVTLPCVLLLLDFWPLQRFKRLSIKARFQEKLILFAIVVAFCCVAFLAQKTGGTVIALKSISLAGRVENATVSYVVYLKQYLWPFDLACFYPLKLPAIATPIVVGSAFLLMALTSLAVWQRQARPYLLMGWLWYLGTLVPVIGLVQVGLQAHADRYTYVPMMGINLALACLVAESCTSRVAATAARLSLVTILAGCTALTWTQIGYWKDGETMWRRAIAVSGHTVLACNGLGESLRNVHRYDEAVPYFREVLSRTPQGRKERLTLGWCLVLAGRYAEADDVFTPLLPQDPPAVDDHYRLGMALLGSSVPGAAVGHFTRVLHYQPENGRAHLQLAVEMMKNDYYTAARREFAEAERLDPSVLDVPGVRESMAALKGMTTGQ